MTSSHSNNSTASNGTKITQATGPTQTAKSGHGPAMTAFKSFVSRSCQRGQKPLTIHCHKTWTGFHGYADRKFNKHDPDSLCGDIEDFLNSASPLEEKSPRRLRVCHNALSFSMQVRQAPRKK